MLAQIKLGIERVQACTR